MIRLGTRGSQLALWQANHIKELLSPLTMVEIKIIRTTGDQIQDRPFQEIPSQDKGFFTKEIEDALLRDEIDLAVHCLKDLPTQSPEGLKIAALPLRASAHDLLIVRPEACLPTEEREYPWILKKGALLGTSAARRTALLSYYRPDLQVKPLRGNVPTRLKKLENGEYEAILLAQAGIERLGLDLSSYETVPLNPRFFPPSPGQGALALQVREQDSKTQHWVERLHHPESAYFVTAERLFLKLFEGGCSLPIGAYADTHNQKLRLTGFVELSQKKLFAQEEASTPEAVAHQLYERFQKQPPL